MQRAHRKASASFAIIVALFSSVLAGAQTTVSPAALSFGSVVVGVASGVKTVKLKNEQETPLTITSLIVSGAGYALDPSTTCANPGTLAKHANCTIRLTLTPNALGAAPAGTLTITTNASNSPQMVPLSGTGVASLTLSPASVSFGTVVLNATSPAKTITLKNNEPNPVAISSVIFGGPFALDNSATSATTCPVSGGSLAANTACVIALTYGPTATGPVSGQITILDSAVNSPQFAALSGSGIAPATASPATLSFGNVVVNTTSAAKNITLTNNQAVALNLTSITVAAPYSVSPATTTCVVGTPVAPRSSCTLALTYSPTAQGVAAAATVSIADDAGNSPQNVNLVGAGVPPVSLTPAAGLRFGTVVLDEPATAQETLKNNQAVPLTIAAITGFTGGYSLNSGQTTCPLSPATLPPASSCVIAVNLTATALGAQPGTLTVNDNAAGSPQTFPLSANAIQPVKLSTGSLGFGAQYEGVTSAPQSVTVTNEQDVPLNISAITITGASSGDFGVTSSCPTAPSSLLATAACPLQVTFTPSASGSRTATLNIVDDALGSPQTVKLSGSGNPPVTISPMSITNFSAPVGTTSAYKTITIKNNNPSVTVNITSFAFSGDFKQTSTTCGPSASAPPPYALAGGASCNVTVSLVPVIGGTRDGQLQVFDDAETSPQVVNLSGTGTSPLTVAPGSLTFSAQKLRTLSPPKNITLTNHESQAETFTLTPAGNFTVTSNCMGGVIAANSTCNLSVVFAPSASATPGPLSGSLTVTDTAPNGLPLNVSLVGSATTTNPPPAVSVVSPGAGAAGAMVQVTITGNGLTNFSTSSQITFTDTDSNTYPSDITVLGIVPALTTKNQLVANIMLASGPNVVYGARNITVVTPLPGGGNETARLNSAFILADPANGRTITTVTPAFGTQGQTLNVNLTSPGSNLIQGVTFANFGDGITVNSLTVDPTDPTQAQANITISNTTFVGYRTITLETGSEFAVSSATGFQIGPNNATLVSVTPNSSGQGTSLPITLTTTGTHFDPDATQVTIGGGVIVGDVQVNGLTATANIAVPADAQVGVQPVTVSTGGEIATLANAFTIVGTTPYISAVLPSSGQQGQTLNVEIQGVNNPFIAGQLLADFTGAITVGTIQYNGPNDIIVPITISQDAPVGSLTARITSGPAGAATIFPFTFSITPSSAQIVSVTPNSVAQGAQVTLTVVGSNTHWVQGTTMAAFYPLPFAYIAVNEVTVVDNTHATLAISVDPNHPVEPHSFYMATGGEVVSSSISVYANTPSMTMSPANGLPGTSFPVSFTGHFTDWSQTDTVPVISGEGVTLSNFMVTSLYSATATVTIAPTAPTTTRLVTFTTGDAIVTTYFQVTKTPVGLIGISPYHAAQSTTLDVTITGLNTNFVQGTTQVLFGPQITVNSVTVNSPTSLVVNITTSYLLYAVLTPTPPGWQNVYVNTGAEMVIGGFDVDPPAMPTIVSVDPSSAQQGSSEMVTITGFMTNWVQGQTELIVGAGVTVAYPITVVSPTEIQANISVSPLAPLGGNSIVTITGDEVVSGAGFSVTPSAANIVTVEPPFISCVGDVTYNIAGCGSAPTGVWVVSQLQTSTLDIVGVGTHWQQGQTSFNFGPGVVVDQLTINSNTTAQVQITVLSDSPVGFVPLTAITGGEVVTFPQAIDIEEGYPTLLAITPTAGEQGATMTLQVLGRFTSWQQGLTSLAFNQDITVNSVNVIDSDNLTANITVSPWAYVDFSIPCGHVLTVTTGSEQVSTDPPTVSNFCVQQGAEQIDSVSPLSGAQGSTEVLTITGSATNFLAGVTQVSFDDPNFLAGEIAVNSPTSLTVPVAISTSATTGFKTVTVQTYGQVASQQYSFTVSPGVATLNEAIPNQAEQGVQNLDVTLVGQYSHFSSLSTATFGAGITVNSVTYVDATHLTANISIDPLSYVGGRQVTVTTPQVPCSVLAVTAQPCAGGATTGFGSEIVSDYAFTIVAGPAIITTVAPATGNQGQEVVFTITGLDTHWQQNFTQFYIAGGGSDITINSVIVNSPTSATVDMSISPTAHPGARSIFMSTAGESLSDSGAFVVTGGIPVVAYISPNSATPGTAGLGVTIYGLYTQWDGTTIQPNFGPGITVNSFQVDDNTHIEAVLSIDPAAQIGYRTVVVQTGTQILTGNFQVVAPAPPPTPYISYYTPSSALTGQTLTISFTGMYTQWDPGPINTPTTATFGDGIAVNTFQVTSPTTALATITIDPNTYSGQRLIVFTTGAETESVPFNVVSSIPGTPGAVIPQLSIVDPPTAIQGAQNINVNILGQYTTFDSTTTFSFPAGVTVNGPPTILGPTIATQSISIAQETATGYYPATATTTDAPGGAQIATGAGITVTPSLALISAIAPNTALQGGTVTVEVTGQNTHWGGGTTFQFGAGIVVTSTQVNSNTDATLTLAVPALAPEGPTNVTAETAGEVASIANGFVVQAGTPLLLSSGPGSAPQQGAVVFTILSQATQWLANPPAVDFGAGVTITNVNVTSNTSLTAEGYIQPTTNLGPRNLTVTTGSQVLSLPNALYVTAGPAEIDSVVPNTGGQGATLPVIITGINTNWNQSTIQLNFPGVLVNNFAVTSPTKISANITVSDYATPGQVSVTATTLGEVATGVNVFTITQTQPELLAVVASSGAQGLTETVTLTGQYTHFNSATSVPNFGAGITVNSVTAVSPTSLQVSITVQPTTTLGYRTVSVSTPVTGGTEGVSLTNAFQVTAGPAAISGLNPATGAQNNTYSVVVTGSQTHFASGLTTASFGGGIAVTGITVNSPLQATVNISIPNSVAVGAYDVSLTTGGEVATILGGFTVTAGNPVLSAVSPPNGNQGAQNLNVSLTGLYTHFVNGTSTANFGTGITVNALTVSDATDAVANISISTTAALGSRNVTVTTGGETASITGGFSVLAGIPTLISATPASEPAGATANIVVIGAFTSFQQDVTTANFGPGITVNSVHVHSATKLTANITVGATTPVGSRTISAVTGGESASLTGGFNTTAGPPIITQVAPNLASPGSNNFTLTITGLFTNWNAASTVAIGDANSGISVGGAAPGTAGPVQSATATSVTVVLTVAANAPVGPSNVSVTTGGVTQQLAGAFAVGLLQKEADSLTFSVFNTPAATTPPMSVYGEADSLTFLLLNGTTAPPVGPYEHEVDGLTFSVQNLAANAGNAVRHTRSQAAPRKPATRRVLPPVEPTQPQPPPAAQGVDLPPVTPRLEKTMHSVLDRSTEGLSTSTTNSNPNNTSVNTDTGKTKSGSREAIGSP